MYGLEEQIGLESLGDMREMEGVTQKFQKLFI